MEGKGRNDDVLFYQTNAHTYINIIQLCCCIILSSMTFFPDADIPSEMDHYLILLFGGLTEKQLLKY